MPSKNVFRSFFVVVVGGGGGGGGGGVYMCVCLCACVRACVRACVHVCVRVVFCCFTNNILVWNKQINFSCVMRWADAV